MNGVTGENPYELERRQRIEKNQRVLRELGIHIAALAIAPVKKTRSRERRTTATKDQPTRRSLRLATMSEVMEKQTETKDGPDTEPAKTPREALICRLKEAAPWNDTHLNAVVDVLVANNFYADYVDTPDVFTVEDFKDWGLDAPTYRMVYRKKKTKGDDGPQASGQTR